MIQPVILLRNFHHLSIPDLLTLARAVASGAIYNATGRYPSPPVNARTLMQQTTDLEQKYDAARNRDAIAVAAQDLAEKILLGSLGELARYAAPIAYNDRQAIEETGFAASEGQTNRPAQPQQLSFTPEVLPGGGLRINLKQKAGAASFTVIVVEAGSGTTINATADGISISGPATLHTDTHPKMTIQSVPRKATLLVYAFATNSSGNGPLSAGMEVTTQ